MSILPCLIRKRILSQVLLATIPVLICGLLIVVHLLQGSFHSIIDINDKLQDFFQKDIITLENEVIRLTDLSYANAAKLEQYKIDNEKHKQQVELYKEGLSAKEAIVGGAIPLSRRIIDQFDANKLSPQAALQQLKNIYGNMAYNIIFWKHADKFFKSSTQEGFSADFTFYITNVFKSGEPDWFEDELNDKDVAVSLIPYYKNDNIVGVFVIIFDISRAYSIMETADRLSLSIKSAKIQEQRLLEGEKSTEHFRKRRLEQRELVAKNTENNENIITKARNDLILFIGGNMTVLIALSIILFWWLGTRRITALRDWMMALTKSNYILQSQQGPSTSNFTADPTNTHHPDKKQKAGCQGSARRLDTCCQDEIGALKKSINYMLDSLDKTKVSKNLLVKENEERKLVEKKLRDNQLRLKTIFDSVQAGVIIIDAETHLIVDANPAALKMTGAQSQQMVDNTCCESICPQKRQECRMSLSGLAIDNQEHMILTLDGHELPVIKTETVIMLGGRRHFICSFVDISALHQARLDIEAAMQNAEQANKAKSQFLANMSHEIRTPLNGVLGMASIALETKLTIEQNSIITTINNEASSLLRIINDILDFSKIEAGKLELEEVDFNLYSLCEEVIQTIIVSGEEKGLEIIFFISPDLPEQLTGDPGRIRQVLRNLCGNALKFTNEGEIYIKVELAQEHSTTNRILFSVEDTGIGIPKNKLAYIFESFRQADGSTTRTYGGTGLGTTISKQLVELMGGEIGVKSSEGAGSTFWFILPLNECKSANQKSLVQICDHTLSGKRVLIVDDNPTNLFILEEYLNSWGCIPVKAADGKEALALFLEAKNSIAAIDLIISDSNMAVMDGVSFVRHLRTTENKEQNTPVIVLSSKDDKNNWDNLHIQGYTNKPILRQEIKRIMCRALCSDSKKAGEALVTRNNAPVLSAQISLKEKAHILLVEDYPTNRIVAYHYLSKAGYIVDMAENGAQAVALIKEKKYAMAFMDIQMPVMDGYTATAKIREWEQEVKQEYGLPIIAMTAHAMNGYREQCIDAGMNDYISKPLKRNNFINMAQKWLSPSLLANIGSSKKPALPTPDTVQSNGSSPVNLTRLMDELLGDKEIVIELFESFSKSLEQQKSKSKLAFENQNLKQLQYESHAVKGAASNVFASDLANIANELEIACKSKTLNSNQDLFIIFEKRIEEVRDYMLSFITNHGSEK